MKNSTAFIAITALLLSVTPAMAGETPVKVDPTKIQKLTEEVAPKPSLADKLAAPFKKSDKSQGDMPPFVDPSKTPPPPKGPPASTVPAGPPKSAVGAPAVAAKPDLKKSDTVKPAAMPAPNAATTTEPAAVQLPAAEEKTGLRKYLPW